MQILIAVIFGAAYGALLHFSLAGRELRGVVLAPVVGAVSAAVAWLALTWSGASIGDPWIWLVSAAVPIVVLPLVLTLLTRVRSAHDTRERARLGI